MAHKGGKKEAPLVWRRKDIMNPTVWTLRGHSFGQGLSSGTICREEKKNTWGKTLNLVASNDNEQRAWLASVVGRPYVCPHYNVLVLIGTVIDNERSSVDCEQRPAVHYVLRVRRSNRQSWHHLLFSPVCLYPRFAAWRGKGICRQTTTSTLRCLYKYLPSCAAVGVEAALFYPAVRDLSTTPCIHQSNSPLTRPRQNHIHPSSCPTTKPPRATAIMKCPTRSNRPTAGYYEHAPMNRRVR